MDRKRWVVIASLVVAFIVVATVAATLWGRQPPSRTVVTVESLTIRNCFTIRLYNETGATTGTVYPPCLEQPSNALGGDYFANTTAQVSVPIIFLQGGNETCHANVYFNRYAITSGWIDGFSVSEPFRIDTVTPPRWDVVNFYGTRGYVIVRMPDQAFRGAVVLDLTGTLNSPDSLPQCP